MLIIDNQIQKELITMRECIAVQEDAFTQLARGLVSHRPRIDVYVPCGEPESYYRWGSMEGSYDGIYACRIKSDIVELAAGRNGSCREMALRGTGPLLRPGLSVQHAQR